MRGGNAQRAQYIGPRYPNNTRPTPGSRRPERRPPGYWGTRKPKAAGVYWLRRLLAISVVALSILALVLATFAQTSGARDQALPIDPNNAGPDTVLAEVGDVAISSPIRPENVTGLGYHPESENLIEMSPRGRNLSGNPVLRLLSNSSTQEKIQYHVMNAAKRQGPSTGALDVGAEAETAVYAPVTGMVTAIRPDPVLQKGANVVEIKPDNDPNIRISISLVQQIASEVGPKAHVTAGITELGKVADSSQTLKPQLASYTYDTGNHVTVSASKAE